MVAPKIDPDSFDKVNYVIDSWTTGCQAPWYIYIETLKPAALEAFIVLISFGWADVLRGALRPKGLGRRTGKRKGRWNRRLPQFPEVGNTIGKALPFGEQLEDFVKWGSGSRFLWRIDNLMQAGLFWWLVADVAEDFAFNWTSLLYESYWCQPDPPGSFSYRKTDMQVFHADLWTRVWFGTEDFEEVPPEWLYYNGGSGAFPATVAAAVNVLKHPAFPAPASFSVRIIDTATQTVYGETGPVLPDAAGNGSAPVTGEVPAHHQFQVDVRMTGTSWAYVTDGVVVGISRPD